MTFRRALLALVLLAAPASIWALTAFSNGTVADAEAINANFAEVAPYSAEWRNTNPSNWVIASDGGTTVALTDTVYESGIQRTGNTWTHAAPGRYAIHLAYRQDSGGDRWTQYAVTKNGASNAVGQSVRTGSIDSASAETFQWTYVVDSTTATYQIVGYQQGANKGVRGTSAFVGDPPWANRVRVGATVMVWRLGP